MKDEHKEAEELVLVRGEEREDSGEGVSKENDESDREGKELHTEPAEPTPTPSASAFQ
jgi:hypothetical protein